MGTPENLTALADPIRRQILNLLSQHSMEAGAIAEQLDLTPSKLSYHLKKLKEANLISPKKSGTHIVYELNLSVLDETILWLYDLRTGAHQTAHLGRRALVRKSQTQA
ncbi:hypothetical protein KIM372_09330 [Bombiscardovia nodaiensis]|uniref:HTH arsR-type domain-containing protein n=1 Tax=Bombiscardovia nodaiensis TaxID=2932181 RepID=A0ABM8B8H5_9BIFI|nr:hypothetical protein KIM372_09330 [Bombiscardovia nodaiensis]